MPESFLSHVIPCTVSEEASIEAQKVWQNLTSKKRWQDKIKKS